MTSFVLVHGGMHAGWCWDRVVPHLEADARVERVFAADLCGHGGRQGVKPDGEIDLEDYRAGLLADLVERDLRDVVLVGHSMAGITIPAVAHREPERIRRLVYLTTTNPPVGRTVNDEMASPMSPLSRGINVVE